MATITFENLAWNHINVQVRVGNNSVPTNNPLVSQFSLSQGQQSQAFPFTVFLFWCRDSNPDFPNGTWTGWTQESATWDRIIDL